MVLPAINFNGYEAMEEQMGPDIPEKNSSKWGDMVVVWRGRMEILKAGDYTFKATTSSPATFRLSGNLVIVATGPEDAEAHVKLDSGYHRIVAIWKAPMPYITPVFQLSYSGPDTDGEDAHVIGYHFDNGARNANNGDKNGGGASGGGGAPVDTSVREGFGLLVYEVFAPYASYPDTGTELPSFVDTYNKSYMDLVCAGRSDTLNFRNHEAWVDALQDERFPLVHAVVDAVGIFKIEVAGTYTFSLTSDDGAFLEIDDDPIVTNEGEGNGEVLHPMETTGTLFLDKGWHSCRVLWFGNNSKNDYAVDPEWIMQVNEANGMHDGEGKSNQTWGTQVLILKYAGPDTGGLDQYNLLHGWHERGVVGLGAFNLPFNLFGGGSSSSKYGERNALHDFDKRWLSAHQNKPWRTYDKADWNKEIGDPVQSIIKPYTDWTKQADAYKHSEVPESVYSHRPGYDRNIVDLGKSSDKWDHSDDAYNGKAVMGKEYDGWDHRWFKTPNSVSPPSGR